MKIDFQKINKEEFMLHDHLVNGEVLTLIQPQFIGAKWNQENKIFRSSLYNQEGELVSAGFPKFVNFGEKPEQFPVPTSLTGCTVTEKLDGSLLIVSRYKGNYILRTRGTVDAQSQLANGHELELFKETILSRIPLTKNDWTCSLLFEWVSPLQKIVINYGDSPDWILVGAINHSDYSLWTQSTLECFAKDNNLKRPPTYTFDKLEDLLSQVELWKGKEGVCIYSKNGQEIHKVKSFSYLKLHRFKSEATFENTVELFFAFDMPSYELFEQKLTEQFDYECYSMVRGYISTICDGWKEVQLIVNYMKSFVEPLKSIPRKDASLKIISSYSTSNRSSYCFQLLDGKELSKDSYKKLIYQVTKKAK